MIKLGIVMDPIANINIERFQFRYVAGSTASWLRTSLYGDGRSVSDQWRPAIPALNVKQNEEWFSFVGEQDLPLADLDVILMRKDPPFDTEFIYATYILERAEERDAIVNKPQSLRDCNEKLFTAWFSDLTQKRWLRAIKRS